VSGIRLVARLRAYHEGRALPYGARRNVLVASRDKTLLLVFVRMGGESIPWAVGYGHPGKKPTILTAPEPRNRDLLAQMLRPLGAVLLEQLQQMTAPDAEKRCSQVWLPGGAHMEMLHYIALRYTFAKRGEAETIRDLNLLGRTAFALFAESEMPGTTLVCSATQALRETHTFPAENVRQEHLGFLLPWIQPELDPDGRAKIARAAEEHAVAPSLDPLVERNELEPLVERWNKVPKDTKHKAELEVAATAIDAILRREIRHRFQLLEQAITLLKNDPRKANAGLLDLHSLSVERLRNDMPAIENGRIEIDGRTLHVRSPESDQHPKVAAARLFELEACDSEAWSVLLHDDDDLQLEAILMGDAVRGEITEVNTAGKTISWTIDTSNEAPLHVREGSSLCVARCPARTATIRSIEALKPMGRRFVVEIKEGKRATTDHAGSPVPAAGHVSLEGTTVTLVPGSDRGFLGIKRRSLWKKDKPGDWVLTAGRLPPKSTGDEDDG
jgi:hypothetical protein